MADIYLIDDPETGRTYTLERDSAPDAATVQKLVTERRNAIRGLRGSVMGSPFAGTRGRYRYRSGSGDEYEIEGAQPTSKRLRELVDDYEKDNSGLGPGELDHHIFVDVDGQASGAGLLAEALDDGQGSSKYTIRRTRRGTPDAARVVRSLGQSAAMIPGGIWDMAKTAGGALGRLAREAVTQDDGPRIDYRATPDYEAMGGEVGPGFPVSGRTQRGTRAVRDLSNVAWNMIPMNRLLQEAFTEKGQSAGQVVDEMWRENPGGLMLELAAPYALHGAGAGVKAAGRGVRTALSRVDAPAMAQRGASRVRAGQTRLFSGGVDPEGLLGAAEQRIAKAAEAVQKKNAGQVSGSPEANVVPEKRVTGREEGSAGTEGGNTPAARPARGAGLPGLFADQPPGDPLLPDLALIRWLDEVRQHPTTLINFTQSDRARVGDFHLPDGSHVKGHGGTNMRRPGIDPLYGDLIAWASAKPGHATMHTKAAAEGAVGQVAVTNSLNNVLASHGRLALDAVIRNAMPPGSLDHIPALDPSFKPNHQRKLTISPDDLLKHIQNAVRNFNQTKEGQKLPLVEPESVSEFLRYGLPSLAQGDSFTRSALFSEFMWPNKRGQSNPFGYDFNQLADWLNDPDPEIKNIPTKSGSNLLLVDPTVPAAPTHHPTYPAGIRGVNAGLMGESDLSKLSPEMFQAAEESFLNSKSGVPGTDAQIRTRAANWLMQGDGGRGILSGPNNTLPVAQQRLLDFLRKAEFDARARIDSRKGKLYSDPLGVLTAAELGDYAIVGASKLAQKSMPYAEWSAEMLKEHGPELEPHLQEIWQRAQAVRASTAGAQGVDDDPFAEPPGERLLPMVPPGRDLPEALDNLRASKSSRRPGQPAAVGPLDEDPFADLPEVPPVELPPILQDPSAPPPLPLTRQQMVRRAMSNALDYLRSPLSVEAPGAGSRPGTYERRAGQPGKAVSDAFRLAQTEITERGARADTAIKQIEELIGPGREAQERFVDLIERDLSNPDRVGWDARSDQALDLHDTLTEIWRSYVINRTNDQGGTLPPDWGKRAGGYFPRRELADGTLEPFSTYGDTMRAYTRGVVNRVEQARLRQEVESLAADIEVGRGTPDGMAMPGMAEQMRRHLDDVESRPTQGEVLLGKELEELGLGGDAPEAAMRQWADRVAGFHNTLKLKHNIKSAAVNLLQPLETLWPYVKTSDYAATVADAMKPSTQKRLREMGVLEGGYKLEGDELQSTGGARSPFEAASAFNRAVGYLYGERAAKARGITDPPQIRASGQAWAERVEFDNSVFNRAPVLRSPLAKILLQYKGFTLKNTEQLLGPDSIFNTPQGTPLAERAGRVSKYAAAKGMAGGLKALSSPLGPVAAAAYLATRERLQERGMDEAQAEKIARALYLGAPSLGGGDISASVSAFDPPFGETPEEKAIGYLGPTVSSLINVAKIPQNAEKKGTGGALLDFAKTLTPYARQAEGAYGLIRNLQGSPPTFKSPGGEQQLAPGESLLRALAVPLARQSTAWVRPKDAWPDPDRDLRQKLFDKEIKAFADMPGAREQLWKSIRSLSRSELRAALGEGKR